ncbi:complex I subunit 5 family protein [Cellvibrio sp. ARAG 10.3]|uniref:complex I subunit 5 family protein n=1 Tax=Cellvibrio sp. ARAG 10.3 TaxID=3451358 RepID=UPI003F454626
MNAVVWLVIPMAPLVTACMLLCWRDRVAPWLWLSCLPALLAAMFPPAALPLPALWPGAQWGAPDMVARAFLGFTALLWGCASLYAFAYHKTDPHRLRFFSFWLLSLSGNLLLIIAQDGASFYVGFTVMSLAAYGLIIHQAGPAPRQAGRLYLQLAVLGEMLLYVGLMLRIHEVGGVYGFTDWQTAPLGGVTAVLILTGFGIKAGFWPLHVWLPLAHPAAPAAASAVLSGAMIKAGILGLWRFMPDSDGWLVDWSTVLFAIGMVSAFYGVALGLVQTKAKAALAYSSVSQVGYLLAILALAWYQPEARALWGTLLALYAVHHGLAKGALFMGAGLASSYRLNPLHGFLMLIPALAIAGAPITSGAAVKTLFKKQLDQSLLNEWLPLLTLGALATALVLARALWLMRHAQNAAPSTPAARTLILPWALLCLMPLLLPLLWPELRATWLASLSLHAIWATFWPLLFALALTLLAIRCGWTIPYRLTHLPNPARYLSLQLFRLVKRPPVPPLEPRVDAVRWRARERRWNHFWQQNIMTLSAWILCGLLLLGWATG